jgi:hypothetical protein
MIVRCNVLGAEMLDISPNELIGNDLSSTLPELLVQQIVELPNNCCGYCVNDFPNGRFRSYIARLSDNEQDAIVISFLREP